MMTMTMMMRTVERNASIYPKLEKLQEKGIPFESIKKKRQAHFPRVCNPEREKKARKNRYIKSNYRSVFLSICASPRRSPGFYHTPLTFVTTNAITTIAIMMRTITPGLKRTMLGQNFPRDSERNT